MEIITLIIWFGAIIVAIGGGDIRIIASTILMVSGLWLVVVGLTTYFTYYKTKKRNEKATP